MQITSISSMQNTPSVSSSLSATNESVSNSTTVKTEKVVASNTNDKNSSVAISPENQKAISEEVKKIFDDKLSLNFEWNKLTNTTIVKFVDNETKEVIKQIPSEEMLKIAENIKNALDKKGFLLSEKI